MPRGGSPEPRTRPLKRVVRPVAHRARRRLQRHARPDPQRDRGAARERDVGRGRPEAGAERAAGARRRLEAEAPVRARHDPRDLAERARALEDQQRGARGGAAVRIDAWPLIVAVPPKRIVRAALVGRPIVTRAADGPHAGTGAAPCAVVRR